ncbi:filamentous hemagglutinin N-terminal domain-containing protein [Paraburkholderia sp. Tr-20389]|uniref:two-partner secretion domain-containing protein n=1 Tax=Paraburkholderia sp. Tr-20389 TaxID=2703903 RepID=UPI00197FAEC6|nr:hemagglutinin repeat-containing protein [Paraburkholderia sp. Tr-20389]MBN3751326.1 filamentous hemagglutinin N-terminal domain-containing protein [Paraburkholderia sp. Tr-20389]
MNQRSHRLVFSRLRGMLIAVEESATASGKSAGETRVSGRASRKTTHSPLQRLAALLPAVAPLLAFAQIVPGGAHAPNVIQTPNGLEQVNINRPSGAGVSVNTYNQFDVQQRGAILNNSPTMVQSQLGGMINGNPNFAPGQAAKVIVNQVNSASASQFNGALEVAGQRANVVLANPSGISVNGGVFINTSRATLTTGTPNYAADGSVSGFNITGGNITVSGAGLNASNVDQVDLLSRAVQANAAVYAKANLNVVTGANSVDYNTLNATPIAGDGAAPGVSIDVSNLGGMYANRIQLVGTELGVGISLKGITAAQSGDLVLTTAGKLVLAGQTNASGNINASAHDGIDNSGTTYAQQNVNATTSGALTNSGTFVAQQNTSISAGSVASTGTLGAGVNSSGSVGNAGDLNVATTGQLSATGLNVAGGNATLAGGGVNLAGSKTAANGNLALNARAGDLNLAGATTSAGGTVNAQATGALINDNGTMTANAVTLNAGSLSNQAGNVSAQGPLSATVAGNVSNQGGQFVSQGAMQIRGGTVSNYQGTMQSAAGFGLYAASLDNTAGRITSLNGDGLNLGITGTLLNGIGGVIGGNGNVGISAYTLTNAGQFSAVGALALSASSLVNSGTATAGGALTATATGALSDAGGTLSGATVAVTGASIDNTKGNINGNGVAVSTPGDLINQGGAITQSGTSAQTVSAGGKLDNSNGGQIASNASNLSVTAAQVDNDTGAITHGGTGTLAINAGNGTGAMSNVGGTVTSNGNVVAQAGAFNNTNGSVSGQGSVTAMVGGALDNTGGKVLSNTDLSVTSGTLTNDRGQLGAGANETIHTGSMTSIGGKIVAPDLSITTTGTLDNSAGDIEANQLALSATDLLNRGGSITQYGASAMGSSVSGTFDNSNGGTLQTNSTDFSLTPWAINNNGGSILHAGTGTFTLSPGNGAGTFTNVGGQLITAGQLIAHAGNLDNTTGVLAARGNITAIIAGGVNNTSGVMRALSSFSLTSGGALTNVHGQIQSGTGAAGDAGTLAVQAPSIDDTNGVIGNLGTGDTTVQGGSELINTGGQVTGNGDVSVNASAMVNTQGGQVSGANVAVSGDTLDNTSGAIGNVAGKTGDVTVTITGAINNTNGQMGATHDLAVSAATLTGGGAYNAANDVAVNLQGDFAPTPDVQFNAGRNLSFTLPGTFTNGAMVQAVNDLNINAGDVDNSGVMMAGGTLTTHANTLENTGVIVGGSVSLNASSSITNVGPGALIGATDSNGTLELLAPDIENRDDTTATDTQATTAIYGLGKVVLAGGKHADGSYSNAALIRNQSALIESAGDMELHAAQVTNTRTTMTTTGFNQPVDPALLDQLGISLSGCTSTVAAACAASHPFVGWINGTPDLTGGVPTDPPHGGQWNSGWQYTTYTGVALANLIAGISPQGQIIAGGNLDASSVGLFQNYWSAVAAAGNLAAPVSLDQNSWQGQAAPGVQVTYSGEYHYTNYDHSINDWQLPFGDAPFVGSRPGGYTQAAPADIRHYSLPGYESSFVAGGTLSGNGISINNTAGNAGIPSLNLAPGQAMSGVNINGISGNASGGKSGAASVNGGGSMVDPAIASATAQNVLQNLSVPQGGLFHPATAPGATYLIETNPAFTNQKTFISSDYYLQQLGLNPQTTEKRLGDGFYEQQLVRNQITSLTGKAVLGPYTDLQSMYQAMLDAGASLSKSLDLPLGMSLSPEQVAALTSNVVIMQTETVNGQQVFVPVVYLAKASQQNMNGPLIAATDIDLQNAQTFTNSGTVQAGNTMSIQGNQINNAFGTLQSGGLMSLNTKGNIDLTSAAVNAGSLALNAGGNLILNTAVNTVNQVSATGATRTTSTLGPIANLNVAGNAAIVTGGNFEQNGASLNVGGNLGMAVGGNYDLGSVQTGEHKVVARANGSSNTDFNQTTGSSIKVGGVSQIGVGGNLTATGANINLGGGGVVAAKGDVTLQAAKATSTVDSHDSGSDSHGSYASTIHRSDDTLTATTLNSGNSLTVASGNNINVTGSTINLDKGTATLAATNNVNIGAATETHVDNGQEQHSHSNVVSGKQVSSSSDTTATLSQGSMVSADAVTISGGHDINVNGSTIVGTNDVALNAAHDVNITTTQDTMQSSSSYQETRTGLGTSGLTITVGTSKLATTDQESSVTNNASTVGSLNGNLSIRAGNTLHVTGSDLVAGGNLAGTAANVIIDAATDTSHQAQTQKTSSSGVTIGLSGSVGDAINSAYAQGQALANGKSNGRADALHAIAAGGDAAMAGMGAAGIAAGATGPNAPSISVQVSIGSSKSQSQSSEDQTTQRGSNVRAGGTAAFVATGDGTRGSGNVTIAGSNVSANDVVLAAKNQVNIVNTTNTDVTQSSNSSSSASVGVSYGTQGFGVSASMSNAHGDANSNAAIQNASHVNGTNSVTVVSGSDTNVIGSQINGGTVNAAVGGNLNIQSVQDTTVSTAHQSSAGGGFSVSQGGGSASFSAQNGHADLNYAGVNEQAGINAGNGGFDINVEGNTGLTGAVISSTADASKNSLSTGTLTWRDIQNQSHYDATSNGISAGVGVGNTGKAVGPGSVSGTGGVTPMMSQNDSGDSSSTTRSAVGAGAINITNGAAQTQDVAGLSRDTTGTNRKVSNTPDVNHQLSQQADTMQAAQAAGQVVAQGIGAYADKKRDDALATAKAALKSGDIDSATAALADYDNWDEGGTDRVALHVAGGALVAGLGGGGIGSAAQGAAGAGIAAWAAGDLNRLANGTRDALGGGDAAQMAGNVLSNVVAGAGGFLIGGTTGAFTAGNADLYNRSTGNGDGKGGTINSAVDSVKNAAAGAWNGLVSLGEVIANVPNGGPFASPGDPGYISANGLKLPYTPGDQVGPGVEFFTAALATRGVGTVTAAEAEAEAQAALRLAQSTSSNSINQADLATLAANGVKFTSQNVVATGTTSSGQTVFLEAGNANAGLQHIIQEHGAEFASMGVAPAQIPDVLMQTVTRGTIVGYQGAGTGRPIYEVTINGQQQRIAVTVGSNGYIVGANPRGSAK